MTERLLYEQELLDRDIQLELWRLGLTGEELSSIGGWDDLSSEQHLLILRRLEQLLVMRAQYEADDEYEEETRERVEQIEGRVGRFGYALFRGVKKVVESGRREVRKAEEIRGSGIEPHKALVTHLVTVVGETDVRLNLEERRLETIYVPIPENATEEDRVVIERFNNLAYELGHTPEEWKFSPKEKDAYKKLEEAFDAAVEEMLTIRAKYTNKEEAILFMFNVEQRVRADQFFHLYPNLEGRVRSQLTGEEGATAMFGRKIATPLIEYPGLFVAGMGIRTVCYSAWGLIAAPAAGGLVGAIIGDARGKRQLHEHETRARRGKEIPDKDKDINRVTNAEVLISKLRELLDRTQETEDPELRELLKKKLEIRLEYTLEKLARGLVNFGDPEAQLVYQYTLSKLLSEAKARTIEDPLNAEAEQQVDEFLESLRERFEAQGEGVKKALLKKKHPKAWGATFGAIFTTAGWLFRDLFYHQHTNIEHLQEPQADEEIAGVTDRDLKHIGTREPFRRVARWDLSANETRELLQNRDHDLDFSRIWPKESRVLIFGEHHGSEAHQAFLIEHMPELKAQDATHIALEWLWAGSELEQKINEYIRTGDPKLREYILQKLLKRPSPDHIDRGEMAIIEAARRNKLQVIGLAGPKHTDEAITQQLEELRSLSKVQEERFAKIKTISEDFRCRKATNPDMSADERKELWKQVLQDHGLTQEDWDELKRSYREVRLRITELKLHLRLLDEQRWAEIISRTLQADPNARIVASVGTFHGGYNGDHKYFNELIEDQGFETTLVDFVGGDLSNRTAYSPSIERLRSASRKMGIADETFVIYVDPIDGEEREADAYIHLKEENTKTNPLTCPPAQIATADK